MGLVVLMADNPYNYQVPVFSSGNSPDILFGEASVLSNRRAPPPNHLETFDVYGADGKKLRGVVRWEYTVYDLSGGLDAQEGAPDNRLASSVGMDWRFAATGILAPLLATATTPDPTSPAVISWANIFGTMVMGLGSAANTSLLKPTSATNFAPAAITWTPGGMVTYLHTGVFGGVANAEWLAVCRIGDNIEIFSDAAATSQGEILSTSPAWGMVTVPLNNTTVGASTHLIYANTRIMSKPSDDTLTTAPTTVLTQIPNGGSAIGSLELGQGFQRAWWHLPRSSTATSMYAATTVLADIWSTNWEGKDPQKLKVSVPYVQQCFFWRGGIFFTDERSAYWHNGGAISNLHWQYQREPLADREVILRTGGVIDDRLIGVAVEMNVATDVPTRFWLEEYIPETDAWYQITASTTVSGGTGDIIRATGQGFPVARMSSTQYGSVVPYLYDEANWRYWKMTPSDWNPYYMARNTSSATVGTDYEYESTGVARSKITFLSGLEAFPSTVYEIQPLFNVNQGGTGATVEIKIANQGSNSMSFTNCFTATFRAADRWDKHLYRNLSNTSAFNRLQFQITATRGSDTRVTPQCVPFIIRGLTFLDGNVRPASSLLGLGAA